MEPIHWTVVVAVLKKNSGDEVGIIQAVSKICKLTELGDEVVTS